MVGQIHSSTADNHSDRLESRGPPHKLGLKSLIRGVEPNACPASFRYSPSL